MKGLAFLEEEYQRRFELVRQEAARRGIAYLLLHKPEHICWISGFDPTGLFYQNQLHIAVESGAAAILTHRAEQKLAETGSWVDRLIIWHHGDDPLQKAVDYARAHLWSDRPVVGMNLDAYFLKVTDYHVLLKGLGNVDVVDVTRWIDDLRLVKSKPEIEVMRRCGWLADMGYQSALDMIRPGVTEQEVNAAIQERLTALGCEYPAFPTLVSSGPRTGMFHALPSTRRLEVGDPIVMEITGVVNRYNANLVRTVFVGKAPADARRIYSIVREAYEAGIELVRPGVPVGTIDRACREARKGYEEYIPARSGFGVELSYPPIWIGSLSILDGDPHILEPGYVFSLEPSISGYRDWTIIIGNNIVVTEEGREVLFKSSIDVTEVG